nr:uncharacterized protein LOC129414594 [Misgurnus anguillicaudatus]
MANKDVFLKYACTFEKVKEAIKVHRQREGTLPGHEGECLVGFGVHRKSTFKELYDAKDRERKSYVEFIRKKKLTQTGSKMDALKKYILQRDQKKIRAAEKRSSSASSASQPVPSHLASPPPTQSSHSQPATVNEPTDADLLASAMEVETQAAPPSTPIRSPRLEQRATPRLSAASEVVLPEPWKRSLPKEQHEWISRALFRNQGGRAVLTDNLQMWWYPPQPRLLYHQPPSSPDVFFTWPLCLWMPYKMWSYKLICISPHCRRSGQRLTACGLYKTLRRVLNLHGWYFLAMEYLECQRCHKKLSAWSYDILDQLDPAHRRMFPAILTYRWPKKLAGTAAWVNNVGNEHGQVLMSVLTSHEGQGLLPMTTGLVRRDCCSSAGTSRAAVMFSEWSDLMVRLDVWHFMRRFAAGHPHYGLFMAKLSVWIFVWDDVSLLREGKMRELEQQHGIKGLTEEQLHTWG